MEVEISGDFGPVSGGVAIEIAGTDIFNTTVTHRLGSFGGSGSTSYALKNVSNVNIGGAALSVGGGTQSLIVIGDDGVRYCVDATLTEDENGCLHLQIEYVECSFPCPVGIIVSGAANGPPGGGIDIVAQGFVGAGSREHDYGEFGIGTWTGEDPGFDISDVRVGGADPILVGQQKFITVTGSDGETYCAEVSVSEVGDGCVLIEVEYEDCCCSALANVEHRWVRTSITGVPPNNCCIWELQVRYVNSEAAELCPLVSSSWNGMDGNPPASDGSWTIAITYSRCGGTFVEPPTLQLKDASGQVRCEMPADPGPCQPDPLSSTR